MGLAVEIPVALDMATGTISLGHHRLIGTRHLVIMTGKTPLFDTRSGPSVFPLPAASVSGRALTVTLQTEAVTPGIFPYLPLFRL